MVYVAVFAFVLVALVSFSASLSVTLSAMATASAGLSATDVYCRSVGCLSDSFHLVCLLCIFYDGIHSLRGHGGCDLLIMVLDSPRISIRHGGEDLCLFSMTSNIFGGADEVLVKGE